MKGLVVQWKDGSDKSEFIVEDKWAEESAFSGFLLSSDNEGLPAIFTDAYGQVHVIGGGQFSSIHVLNDAIPKNNCGTCKFWNLRDATCRHKAPNPGSFSTIWSSTTVNDWCAEWEAKP